MSWLTSYRLLLHWWEHSSCFYWQLTKGEDLHQHPAKTEHSHKLQGLLSQARPSQHHHLLHSNDSVVLGISLISNNDYQHWHTNDHQFSRAYTPSDTNRAVILLSDQLLDTCKVGQTVLLWSLFRRLWVCKAAKNQALKWRSRYAELY